MKATCQTRIAAYGEGTRAAGDRALSAYAGLYGQVERRLRAEMEAGESAASLKSAYLERCGIPARMFNALRVSLQGKAASVRESQKLLVDHLRRRIARAKKRIAKARRDGCLGQAHHKRRRLANPEHRPRVLETEFKAGFSVFALGRESRGASSIAWKPMAAPAMRSGSRSRVMLAKASFSCWAAATRRRVASCAWPVLAKMVR